MGAANMTRVVFQPPIATYSRDPNLIWLKTSRGDDIPAFYIQKDGARFTFLFSHGNAEDLGLIVRYFHEVSHRVKVSIFSYEYTGYGMSTGRPQEASVYADIEAAFQYVRDTIGTPWECIIPYGRSIGTGPTCHLATRSAVRGIILQSPMVSIYRIIFRLRYTLPGDQFANIDKVSKMCCPVFIIHGMRDEIVPPWHGLGMHEACAKRGIAYTPHWVELGDHNNLESQAGDAFFESIKQFLNHLENAAIDDRLMDQSRTSAP